MVSGLSALTKLDSLVLGWASSAERVAGLSFPPHLTYLELNCNRQPLLATLQVTNLQQLRVLVTSKSIDDAQTMRRLAIMPHLQEVSLGCRPIPGEGRPLSLPAWHNLRQLRALSCQVKFLGDRVLAEVTSAQQQASIHVLTKLALSDGKRRMVFDTGPHPLCERLSHLTSLCSLDISWCNRLEGDLSHLLPLARLTCLKVACDYESEALALRQLAGHLTGLRELHLQQSADHAWNMPSGTRAPLELPAALATFTGLHRLDLGTGLDIESAELRQLCALTGLTRLTLYLVDDAMDLDVDDILALLAAAPGLANGGLEFRPMSADAASINDFLQGY